MLLRYRGRAARSETIDPDEAEPILDYREAYEYATDPPSSALTWDCGSRIGAVRAIDLTDDHSTEAHIELHHRPEGPTEARH